MSGEDVVGEVVKEDKERPKVVKSKKNVKWRKFVEKDAWWRKFVVRGSKKKHRSRKKGSTKWNPKRKRLSKEGRCKAGHGHESW